jgi:hypothetical protein
MVLHLSAAKFLQLDLKDKMVPICNKMTGETGKWYLLLRDAYPNDYSPSYAPGVKYALSREFAGCVADNVETLIWMPWEDDAAAGILASQSCYASLASADAEDAIFQ